MSIKLISNPYQKNTIPSEAYAEGYLAGSGLKFEASEKGNSSFSGDQGKEAVVVKVSDDVWLLSEFNPDSSPSWCVSTLNMPEVDVAEYIQERFEGWRCNHCSFDGMDISSDRYVLAIGEVA